MNLNITFTANKHEISRALLIVHTVHCRLLYLQSECGYSKVKLN